MSDNTAYADPGYQEDGRKRYPVDTADQVRSAWSHINLVATGRQYSRAQFVSIRERILLAAVKCGVDIHAETAAELARLRSRYGFERLEPAAGPVDADGNPNGCMVAFYPSPDLAQLLAVEGGEDAEELHVTLAFLGDAPEPERLDQLRTAVAGFAQTKAPVTGQVSGIGVFTAGETPVTYASVDCPDLPAFRQALVDALTAAGFPPDATHGYTPHMTLTYAALADATIPNAPVSFGTLWVVAGVERHGYTLDAPENAALKQKHPAGWDAETEVIKQNRLLPTSSKKHPYRAGDFTDVNGKARCLMCGADQPGGGFCNVDGDIMAHKPGAVVIPVAANDETDAAKIAAGIDAAVDQALVLLRSINNDELAPYAQQARDLLQAVEPACDALLEYFGVTDADQQPGAETAASGGVPVTYTTPRTLYPTTATYPTTTTSGSTATYTVQNIVIPTPAEARQFMHVQSKQVPTTKAFIAEINGKTILTTQASTELAGAMTSHEHYLWTSGRLVGADEANRNGAYWSSGDLELGQTTVPYGPLNWLHEERHVVGSIAAASYAKPGETSDLGMSQNHIAIAAPVWRWLYPDEAAVIEMASDAGKFWYSMECISKEVACVGDGGCGAQVSYLDYMQGLNGTCQHMIERSGTRRFVDPVFLGAAIIVPPVRPGWAGADASVAKQAAAIAEKAFDAAKPDMSASDWEQLMSQVVRSAIA